MGRTLFEILKTRLGPAAELQIYNPLKLKLGAQLQIDRLDYRDKDYQIHEIEEYSRPAVNKDDKFVDYCLLTKPPTEDLKLRLSPIAIPSNGLPYQVVLLSLYYQCGYQEAIDSGLQNSTDSETFEIDWEGKRVYYRMNDLRTPHSCVVKTLSDPDGNGLVDDDEIVTSRVDYWDYHTELQDEANQTYLEYLFVETNTENGWWQIWRGVELNPEQVTIL